MSRYRYYREDESSSGTTIAAVLLGAAAGFAVGMFVAQRAGGLKGLAARLRAGANGDDETGARQFDFVGEDYDEIEDSDEYAADGSGDLEDELEAAETDETDEIEDAVPLLEERVLEAFNNDPILSERAVDIGAVGDGIIELAGWVDTDEEAEHAVTIARGVPGVDTVVNRLLIDEEEEQLSDTRRRLDDGDPALKESRWEGQQVGTGRRRQGSSDEPDRHADPKPHLEDRWLSEREAIRNAADDIEDIGAERRRAARKRTKTGDEAEA